MYALGMARTKRLFLELKDKSIDICGITEARGGLTHTRNIL
jgi:hypothetical protein